MDGEPPQEEDFSLIPLLDRSQHKNWKARLSAYTEIISKSAKTASDSDPFFRPYVSDGALLKKWCLDANVVAQEKAIEAILAIAQYSGDSIAKCRSDVVPALVDKALGSVRQGTKKKATDLCCMFVEIENGGDGVISDVLVGLDSKQPKVVAGSIGCLKEIIESFGVPAAGNIKPVLKALSKIFGHTDKTVRAEGTSLVRVLYTFLGPAIQASLADLKPVQVSELQKAFEGMDAEGKGAGTGRPTRYTRKEQQRREASGGQEEAAEEVVAAPIDPRSLLDAVNVLDLFPSDLDERLSSTKWKDRLDVLEECNKVLAAPQNARITDRNIDAYSSLATTLGGKIKSDANVNVVIEASKVVDGLAKGLGKPFGRFKGSLVTPCLERLKERKANVVEAIAKALDGIFETVTINDTVEDVLAQAKSKNPQVKEGSLKFLHRSLTTTTEAPSNGQIKPIAETLVSLLGDGAEPVRTSAAECLGTMMKIIGERAFNPYIEGVGDLQMAKVKDAFAKAEIRYRGGKAAPNAAPKAVPAPAPVKKPTTRPTSPVKPSKDALADDFAPPARAPPARFAPKAPAPPAPVENSPPKPAPMKKTVLSSARPAAPAPKPAAPASKPAASAKAGPSKTLVSSPSEPVKYKYSNDDALAQAADLIPAEYHTKFADAAWKTRLEAAEEMVTWVSEDASKVDSEIMMRFLGKTPGWGEKNFQVSAKVFQVMQIVAEKSPSFGKPSAALCVGPLSDKLGDLKLKKPAGDAMVAFAEKTSLAFVLAQAYDAMKAQKAPKAQADALTWIKQQLVDFGIAGIPMRDLIGFVKTALGSANPLVRTAATQLLVTIRIAVGADISGFLEDVNPTLLTTINNEFDKVSGQTAPEPTKTQADLSEVAAAPGKPAAGDALDDLIPRVDLDKLVNQTSVLADSKSDAWKVRKEAFEALAALLEVKSNSRLKPNMGDIGAVLKKAMADTNLAVKMLALSITSKIATGMGQPFEKYTRLLVGPVASVCADQKATTRSAGLATLSAIADACGLDAMYFGLAGSLETNNPALRASVLGWIAERFAADPPSPSADLGPLAGPVVSCLEDRNGDVRKGATAILPFVVASAGFDHVMDQTSKLKPASKATIIPLINGARSAPATSAPTPAPTKAAPAVAKIARAPVARTAPASPAPGPSIKPPARSLAMKALSNPSTRPASSQDERPTGLKPRTITARPTSAASHAAAPRGVPFLGTSPDARTLRLKKDGARWTLESPPKPDIVEYLHAQMESCVNPELLSSLFSKDHRAEEDYMAGLSTFADFYADATAFGVNEDKAAALQLANSDLALKYTALRLMSNNTQMTNRCLEVLTNVLGTLQRLNERISDAEAKLFVPALIFKLADSKFLAKLLPIFDSLDKVMAGSQVVQLLVQYGLEDKAGKTCKNESLALIEKAYRKRGSILRTRDDKAFFEALAKCISDSGTRSAALSLMALLQIQGGSKALDAVVENMPQGAKDMLANRRATMATAKSGIPAPMSRSDTGASTPSRLPRSNATPSSSRSPSSAGDSPARTAARTPSRLPTKTSPSPVAPGRGAMSAIPAPKRADFAKPSLQPLPRATGPDPILRHINDIRSDDLEAAVDALKYLQVALSDDAESLRGSVQTLVDTLMDAMDRAFSPPENLQSPAYFRFVKHIIQTASSVSSNQDLMRRLAFDQIYTMISALTLHLVQSDRLGGNIAELSRFINMILIQALSTPDRDMVFKAMFTLLLSLIKDFAINRTPADSIEAAHADLVIKCLWKRCKVLDDDFRSGRLTPAPMLRTLEHFLQTIQPQEFRRRAQEKVALGDMPLRTVKTVLQKMIVWAKNDNVEIYDILRNEFGEDAAQTIVYTYVFRLAGSDTALEERPKFSMASQLPSANSSPEEPPSATMPETEGERIVRMLLKAPNSAQELDNLYAYIRGNPDKENEVHEAIAGRLSAPVQIFVRRALEQRKMQEATSPGRASPRRPESFAARGIPRKSIVRPTSMAVDKSAPVDDQLSTIKNIFARGALSSSTSHEGYVSRPLSEISPRAENLDID